MADSKTPQFELKLGTLTVSSAEMPAELVSLDVYRALGAAMDYCCVRVFLQPPQSRGDLVDLAQSAIGEIAGAVSGSSSASTSVRGTALKLGDSVSLKLTAAEDDAQVFSGELWAFAATHATLELVASSGGYLLARARSNEVLEQASASDAIQRLASAAGITVGTVDSGRTYPYLVLADHVSTLAHARTLAQAEGLDLFIDADGKLNATAFNKTQADHV